MFIVLEGVDNTGKTTQSLKLRDYFENNDIDAFLTAQPSRSHFGVAVKELVMNHKLRAQTECLLFAAEMAEHTRSHILPAIKAGKTVICDRFADSMRAYQGGGDGVSKGDLASAISVATAGLQPDLTIVIDLDYIECIKRKKTRIKRHSDQLDEYSPVRHNAIRKEYKRLVELSPSRMVMVDGGQTENAVHKEILSHVNPFVNGKKGK